MLRSQFPNPVNDSSYQGRVRQRDLALWGLTSEYRYQIPSKSYNCYILLFVK